MSKLKALWKEIHGQVVQRPTDEAATKKAIQKTDDQVEKAAQRRRTMDALLYGKLDEKRRQALLAELSEADRKMVEETQAELKGAAAKSKDARAQREQAWAKEKAQVPDVAKYTRGGEAGQGGFGKVVFLNPPADAKADGGGGQPKLVMKTAFKGGDAGKAEMQKEADVYAKVGPHPNIVRCLGVQKLPVGEGGAEEEGLVMEAVTGGELSDSYEQLQARREKGEISEEEFWGTIQFTMSRTLEALAHVEKAGIAHRDVKPPNILIDAETGEPKLMDFGISAEAGKSAKGSTPGYAPADGLDNPGGKSDAFGVGGMGYEIAQGNTGKVSGAVFDYHGLGPRVWPELRMGNYAAQTKSALDVKGVKKEDVSEEELAKKKRRILRRADRKGIAITDADAAEQAYTQIAAKTTGQASDLVADAAGNSKRQKKKGVYAADTAYVDFINRMMDPDPAKRPTLEEALAHPFLSTPLVDEEQAKATLKGVVGDNKAKKDAPKRKEAVEKVVEESKAELAGLDRELATMNAESNPTTKLKLAKDLRERLGALAERLADDEKSLAAAIAQAQSGAEINKPRMGVEKKARDQADEALQERLRWAKNRRDDIDKQLPELEKAVESAKDQADARRLAYQFEGRVGKLEQMVERYKSVDSKSKYQVKVELGKKLLEQAKTLRTELETKDWMATKDAVTDVTARMRQRIEDVWVFLTSTQEQLLRDDPPAKIKSVAGKK